METQIENEGFSTKEKLLYTGGSILLAGGLFFFGKKLIQKLLSNREEKRSFEEGSPQAIAKRIKMAFDNDGWFGTNTTELRSALTQVGDRPQFEKVQKAYQHLFSKNMLRDMADELQSSEYSEMLSIIAAKPTKPGLKAALNYDGWAKRLKAAFDKTYGFIPGTDEQAIKAVFQEIPTQDDFVKTSEAYQRQNGRTLVDDLKSELEMWEYADYMKIITSKPQH